ncbi:DUF3157 family protein [Vibrio sinensis]|nr:DUF3157 family protein [Vibrio sinensis]
MNYFLSRSGLFLGLFLSVFISSTVLASDVFTLPDGRHVQLNEDFTWQYVTPENRVSETAEPIDATAKSATVIATTLIAKNENSAALNLGEPSLKLSDSGIEIQLDAAKYEDGQVVIPTTISNNSRNAVVDIEIEVTLSDTNGNVLAQEQVTVFRAIKRMAETYLRPKQVITGLDIQLNAQQATQYQMSAQVIEINNH